jgi:hypothetical protein
MEAAWNSKKRVANTAVQKGILIEKDKDFETKTGDKIESYHDIKQQKKNHVLSIDNENSQIKGKTNVYSDKSFESWKFGTINIRYFSLWKEKDEGSKIAHISHVM